jgi:hypothetical protein
MGWLKKLLLGIAIVLVGVFFDIWFAGIPFQDVEPELQQSYGRNSEIAAWIRTFGMVLSMWGLAERLFARPPADADRGSG